jgi:hypothetical protein
MAHYVVSGMHGLEFRSSSARRAWRAYWHWRRFVARMGYAERITLTRTYGATATDVRSTLATA